MTKKATKIAPPPTETAPPAAPEQEGEYLIMLPKPLEGLGGFVSRIVGVGQKRASQFLAHPDNPHIHPLSQRTVIRANLDTLGWVGMAAENKNSGYLIDGHERVWQALSEDDAFVPYYLLDLTPEQEAQALATYDPTGDMARYGAVQMGNLLARFRVEDENLTKMLKNVLKHAHGQPADLDTGDLEPGGEGDEPGESEGEEAPVSPIRMAHLFLNTSNFDEFMALSEALYPVYQVDNLTDLMLELVREVFSDCVEKGQITA